MGKCNTCKHCKKAPANPNYKDTFGWCLCPKPFFIQTEPLIYKKDFSNTRCRMYQRITVTV